MMKAIKILALLFLITSPLNEIIAQDILLNIQAANPNSANNATITLDLLTADAPFYFNWEGPSINSSNQHDQNLSELQPGEYCVSVTNALGCIAKGCARIPDCSINALPLSLNANITCSASSNSWLVDLIPRNGFPYYTYQWTGPDFNGDEEDIEVSKPGRYSVIVTDLCGNRQNASYEVGVLVEETITPVCDEADGTIALSLINGELPVNYEWNTGETTAAITGLSAGSYTVNITEQSGCSISQTYQVPQGLSLNADITPSCPDGPNGSINLLPIGGTGAYLYTWSHTNNSSPAPYAYNLAAGQYCVTLTDANNCSTDACFEVPVDAQGQASVIESAMIEHICGENGTGSIDLQLPGNPNLYTIEWGNGAQGPSINQLAVGSYCVTVTTAFYGCESTACYDIIQSSGEELSISASRTHACRGSDNGAIAISLTGGNGSPEYQWSTGQSTQDIHQLAAGTYCVTVTAGCSASACFNIQEYYLSAEAAITPGCENEQIGAIQVQPQTVSINTPEYSPYSYQWNNGLQTSIIDDLAIGNYQLTLSDANGCSFITNYDIDNTITVEAQIENACLGEVLNIPGSISVAPSGGIQPYTFNWNNGRLSSAIDNLEEGIYQLTVSDDTGCSSIQQYTVLNQRLPIIAFGHDQSAGETVCHLLEQCPNTEAIEIALPAPTVYTPDFQSRPCDGGFIRCPYDTEGTNTIDVINGRPDNRDTMVIPIGNGLCRVEIKCHFNHSPNAVRPDLTGNTFFEVACDDCDRIVYEFVEKIEGENAISCCQSRCCKIMRALCLPGGIEIGRWCEPCSPLVAANPDDSKSESRHFSNPSDTPHLKEEFISVTPNPFQSEVRFTFNFSRTNQLQLILIDLQGRIVLTKTIDSKEEEIVIDTSALPQGLYFTQFILSNQQVYGYQKICKF